MDNKTLNAASKAKNDEFYTQIPDIEKECAHYRKHFRGKTIFCNCDDPETSGFWRYFHLHFSHLKLKKLISTHFAYSDVFKPGNTYLMEYAGGSSGADADFSIGSKTILRENGDFRSPECIAILQTADAVITNPPFSLFREYVAQLIEYDKKFLIIGSLNAITYKEIFKLIKDNKIWLGVNNGSKKYIVPSRYVFKNIEIKNGIAYAAMGNTGWFTNLDIKKRHEELILWKKYTPEDFPKYDNYDAIEVSKVVEIPCDYDGIMGVPVTFLDKHNPAQFDILGNLGCYAPDGYSLVSAIYVKGKKIFKRIAIKRKV